MSIRRVLAALVCWTLLAGAAAPPAAGTAITAPGPDATVTARTTGVGSGATAPPDGVVSRADPAAVQANNTTVRHRNPDRRDGDGDLAAVRSHLAGRMGDIIVDCSRSLGAGDVDPCERLNGSYDDALSKYVEVSRETNTGAEDRTAEDLRRTRREGREYARTVREFEETYAAYRRARENGNASGARRKARELRELADDAERTGGNLTRSLGNLTREGVDVSEAGRAVNGTTANVTGTVEGIESTLFVRTNTTARTNRSTASFLDPLVVTGRVTTANGTAVPNASVGLSRVRTEGAERVPVRARTNATGHYRLVYRPVTVPVGSVPVALRLLPGAESPYLPSNATVTVRIEQVDAALAVRSAPAAVAYRDRVRVRVRVAAEGATAGRVAVERLPVTTRVGEFRIGSGTTGEGGETVVDGRFPAAVEPGERTLVVGFDEPGRAIAPVTESVALDVRETTTALSATARTTGNASLAVEGRLATAGGRPLAGRTVRVTLDGRSVGTLRTRRNGSFDGNLTVPRSVLPPEGSAERTVRLAFDGSGGNLAPAETTTTVRVRAAADPSEVPDGTGLALVLAVLLLAAVAGAVRLGRRRAAGAVAVDARDAGQDGTASESAPDAGPADPLDTVRAAMDAGDYDLVTTAGYRAVRRALAEQVGAGPEATHWEFYGACAADGVDPARLEAVRGLTERFERVTFAPDEASRSVAAASLVDAETVLCGEAAPDGAGSTAATGDSEGSGGPTDEQP